MVARKRARRRIKSRRRPGILHKAVNRRVDPEAGRKRARIALWVVSHLVGVLVLFCAFVGLGILAQDTYRDLARSDTFALEELVLEGASRLSREDVLQEMGVSTGVPLLELDTEILETRLSLHPWVKDARVRRRLPHRLEVSLEERIPAAVVALGRLYLVDRKGAGEWIRLTEDGRGLRLRPVCNRAPVSPAASIRAASMFM